MKTPNKSFKGVDMKKIKQQAPQNAGQQLKEKLTPPGQALKAKVKQHTKEKSK